MLFQRFFKQPKPNKFGYTPVYYDERKEDLQRRIKEAEREKAIAMGQEVPEERIDFRGKFGKDRTISRNQSLDKFRKQGARRSNKMLVLILLVLSAIVYIQFI